MVDARDFLVPTLGECHFRSPIADVIEQRQKDSAGREFDRVLLFDTVEALEEARRLGEPPSFEVAGPRTKLFFDPEHTKAGIVTCGGLCPGLNDVIRGLVMIMWHRYGIRDILGFRYGYAGLNPAVGRPPMKLSPHEVSSIHEDGGTILGSSRGPQDIKVMVDTLEREGIRLLFPIGGDGTQRGAIEISQEARRRNYPLAVVGVPKTVDNDIQYIERSFGFQTAFGLAVDAIRAAHIEAQGVEGGIGLVKVMGRHSGFLAAYAALANNDANFVLIPEVPFPLEGPEGLLPLLKRRLQDRGHAVIVVGEGAGTHLMEAVQGTDASGNRKLGDVGGFLRERIGTFLNAERVEYSLKFIDPSYIIRSLKADASDSVYCFRLAAYAVHAAMAGRTEMLVGNFHGRFVHVPTELAVRKRQQIDPNGDLWLSVLEATGQPRWTP